MYTLVIIPTLLRTRLFFSCLVYWRNLQAVRTLLQKLARGLSAIGPVRLYQNYNLRSNRNIGITTKISTSVARPPKAQLTLFQPEVRVPDYFFPCNKSCVFYGKASQKLLVSFLMSTLREFQETREHAVTHLREKQKLVIYRSWFALLTLHVWIN